MSAKFITILQSMYGSARFSVKIRDGCISDPVASETGVLQGEQLSPLLFLLYIADIPEAMLRTDIHAPTLAGKDVPCLFYADDDAAMATSALGLQRHLNAMSEYCREWGMTVNVDKTKIVTFEKSKRKGQHRWTYNGKRVEQVKEFKYLGVTLSRNGKWDRHLENVSAQGLRLLPSLSRFMFTHSNIAVSVMLYLFDTLVAPVLLYGCELWAWTDKPDKIDRVARRFYKKILRLPSSVSDIGVELLLGRVSLGEIAKARALKFLLRIPTLPQERLMQQAALLQGDYLERDRPCWLKAAKDDLEANGLGHLWRRKVENIPAAVALYKERLCDQSFQTQIAHASTMSSTKDYATLKTAYGMDPLLSRCCSSQLRRLYCLIMMNNPGSYVSRPAIGMTCVLCNQVINNVFIHRILQCPRKRAARQNHETDRWFVSLQTAPQDDKVITLKRKVLNQNTLEQIERDFFDE